MKYLLLMYGSENCWTDEERRCAQMKLVRKK